MTKSMMKQIHQINNYKNIFLMITLLLSIINLPLIQCIPIRSPPPPQSSTNTNQYPKSYNLFTEIDPNDINELEPSHVKRAMVDVSETIAEVQKLLENDPNLPRLTRGEIEDLFENVTREEMEMSLRNGNDNRAKHMRALMLVLPYNANDDADGGGGDDNTNLEDIYRRPPITKLVNDDGTNFKSFDYNNNNNNNNGQSSTAPNGADDHEDFTIRKPYSENIQDIIQINNEFKQTPKNYDDKITITNNNNNYNNLNALLPSPVYNGKTTEKFSSHFTSKGSKTPNSNNGKQQHGGPMRENVKDMLAAIGLTPDQQQQQQQEQLEQTTLKFNSEITTTTTTNKLPPLFDDHDDDHSQSFLPTKTPELTPELLELLQSFGLLTNDQQPSDLLQSESVHEKFHPMISNPRNNVITTTDDDHHVDNIEFKPLPPSIKSQSLRMITVPELTPTDYFRFKPLPIPNDRIDDFITVNDNNNNNIKIESSQQPEINSDVEKLLEAYGLIDSSRSSRASRKQKSLEGTNEMKEDEQQKNNEAEDRISLADDMLAEESTTIETIVMAPTTKIPLMEEIPEVQVDFLSHDLMNVLGNIGIDMGKVQLKHRPEEINQGDEHREQQEEKQPQEEQNQKKVKVQQKEQQETNTERYSNILSLTKAPKEHPINNLDINLTTLKTIKHQSSERARRSDAPNPVYNPENNPGVNNQIRRQSSSTILDDAFDTTESSDPLRFTLDLNIKSTNDKSQQQENSEVIVEEPSTELPPPSSTTTTTSTISSSSPTELNESELKLITNFKSVDEEEIIDDDTVNDNVDDVNIDAIENKITLENVDEEITTSKSTDDTSSTTSSSTTSSSSSSSTTEESRNGSISDLEDSFAGDDGGLDPVSETPLPQPRRNGFYFLADWNSFLEVGEDPNKVVVRFDPKIGDPSRFIPVTIP